MKKTLATISISLLLSTSTVSAATIEQIYGINANEYPHVSQELPLVAVCKADEVNVRNEPNTSSEVVANIDKNSAIYVHSNPIKSTESTIPWYEVTIDNGTHGYIRADFIDHHPNKLEFKYRFEAAFKSSVLFDTNQLRKATHYTGELHEIVPKPRGYETHSAEFMDGIKVHTMADGYSKDVLLSAKVTTPNYTVAGLKVGDDYTPNTTPYINEAMEQMKWSYYGNIEDSKDYYAMWVFKVKRSPSSDTLVPIKGFRVHYLEGKITGFSWSRYLID